MLKGKTVLLGVSGGIAAYKAVSLCSKLVQAGALVDVVMTDEAMRFVQPLTFQAISRRPVLTDTFKEEDPAKIAHIDVAERADLIVVAPASASGHREAGARLCRRYAHDGGAGIASPATGRTGDERAHVRSSGRAEQFERAR